MGEPMTVEIGNGEHEPADDARAVSRREPERDVEDHARKKAGLGDAEQEAHDVEAGRAAHPGLGRRQDAPAEHDAGDPAARAEAFQRHVARHLEQEVREKEDAGRAAEHGGGEAQVLGHGGAGKAEVHAVEVGDEVADHQQRQQPPADFRDGSLFDRVHESVSGVGMVLWR
jgi:hypothetical protein